MKCFVKGCENHDHEGKFMGYLCLPCHHFIAGKSGGEYSQAARNLQEAIAAEREECAKVCEAIPLPGTPTAITHLPTIERCAAAIRARGER